MCVCKFLPIGGGGELYGMYAARTAKIIYHPILVAIFMRLVKVKEFAF